MNAMRPHSIGLTLAIFAGSGHALWSLLVLVGFAQPVLDFVFGLHMISPPYQVGPFQAGTAAALILLTAAGGYSFGWLLGFLWNHCASTSVR